MLHQTAAQLFAITRRSWSSASSSAWIDPGLSFKCTGCGKCCTGGPERLVWVNEGEAAAIAKALYLSTDDFKEDFLTAISDKAGGNGRFTLRKNDKGNACVFLDGKKCRIYADRPMQCRTYPFWPEIVLSEYDWAAEGQRCEGVSGRGSAAGAASGSAPPRPQLQSIDAHRENAAQRQRQWQQEAGLPGGSAAGSGTGSANARPPESSANGGEPAAESETERISAVVIRQQLLLQELHANNALPEMTYSTAWELVQELPEEAVAESVSGLWAGSRREAIHEDARFWVLDSCVAPADESKPAAWSRALVARGQPAWVQSSMRLSASSGARDLDPEQPAWVQSSMRLSASSGARDLDPEQPAWVQSSMRLSASSGARDLDPEQRSLDATELLAPAHQALCLALPLLTRGARVPPAEQAPVASTQLQIAVIGAGAGSLPSALHHHLPAASICAVDLDPEILSLGRRFFGLTEDERLVLRCADGLQFLAEAAAEGRSFDVLIVDVADTSAGGAQAAETEGCLTAPPPAFLSSSAVQAACQCLSEGGVVALHAIGPAAAVAAAASRVSQHVAQVHVLRMPAASVIFGRKLSAGSCQPVDSQELHESVMSSPALKALCQGIMEPYGGTVSAAAYLKQHYGFGWLTESELSEHVMHSGS